MAKKVKTECHICRFVIKGEEALAMCPRCESDLVNREAEKLIDATYVTYSDVQYKSIVGHLYLSDKRLMWFADVSADAYGGGLTGIAFANKQKGKCTIIPLSDIVTIEESKFGLFAKGFSVTLNNGTAVTLRTHFGAKMRADWKEKITQACKKFNNI